MYPPNAAADPKRKQEALFGAAWAMERLKSTDPPEPSLGSTGLGVDNPLYRRDAEKSHSGTGEAEASLTYADTSWGRDILGWKVEEKVAAI